MIIWLFLMVLVLWSIVFRFRRRRLYKLASLIPGSKEELPIIGNAHSMMGDTEDMMLTLQRYSYESMQHNGLMRTWMSHLLYFMLVNPVDQKKVLKSCLEKDDIHRFLKKVTGNGSIFAPVPIWRQRRKSVDMFSRQSEIMVQNLSTQVGKGKFSVWSYISRYSLDAIGGMYVMKIKREERTNQNNYEVGVQYYDLSRNQQKSFLDLLTSPSGDNIGYSDREIKEEMMVIFVAGTDTSAVCIGNTLQLLGKYPKIQNKVYKELSEVFGESERPLVKEDLPELQYLERVIKESLRLLPPVPFIARKVSEDITLPSGRILPAGSGVVISIWGAHRDPKYWGKDAEVFDPDRFLPERFNLQHDCSYMPFSDGPRNCPGFRYAMMSIKTALSMILRRYRVVCEAEQSSVPRIRVKMELMLRAVDDYEIVLENRKSR